jgi:hypothetical protein
MIALGSWHGQARLLAQETPMASLVPAIADHGVTGPALEIFTGCEA